MNSNAVQHVEEAKALTAFLREATENLLNREAFAKMKDGVIIINTAQIVT